VLAAVQAQFIATLMQQQLWHPVTPPATAATTTTSSSSSNGSSVGQPLTPQQLHEALINSLSHLLWSCACSSSGSSSGSSSRRAAAHVATIPQSGMSSAGLRGLCDVGQVLRMVAVAIAHSLEELQVGVRAVCE
jgi:hypothetical protein